MLIMTKKKKQLVSDEQMLYRANLNNLEPASSVHGHHQLETGNLILTTDEIKQQNENL